jgi:hypothetical protein
MTGWDPLLPGIHVSQTLRVLLYNRVQNTKMAQMRHASTVCYATFQTGSDISRILRDVYIYAYVANALSDTFLLQTKIGKYHFFPENSEFF